MGEFLSKRQRIVTSIVKKRKSQRQTQIVVGSTKANTRKSLSVLPKWLMLSMVEPWLIRLKQEMFMIARLSLIFFKVSSFLPILYDCGFRLQDSSDCPLFTKEKGYFCLPLYSSQRSKGKLKTSDFAYDANYDCYLHPEK